jgi:hypothetical protein
VDGGKTPGGKPSTVVDATSAPPQILRAGAYAWAQADRGPLSIAPVHPARAVLLRSASRWD